jgi:hypothetical protein
MAKKQEPFICNSKLQRGHPGLTKRLLLLVVTLFSFAAFVYALDPRYDEQNDSYRAGYTYHYNNVSQQDLNFRYVEGYADGHFRKNPLFSFDQQDGLLPVTVSAHFSESYGRFPLQFELNRNQNDNRVKFFSRGSRYTFFLTPTEALFVLRHSESEMSAHVFRMKVLGSNSAPVVVGLEELLGKSNYFSGSDPEKWDTQIPNYAKVKYENIYDGINLIYYGNQRQLEFDFVVAPGVDPNCIQLEFEGMNDVALDSEGNLVLYVSGGSDLIFQAPVIYQQIDGKKQSISGSYLLGKNHQVGFKLASYDRRFPVIIDPVLSYSSYLGGTGFDNGNAIAVDSSGNAYVTGQTATSDFPTTVGAFQTTYGGGDAFITKINPSGSSLVYSTYIHGATAYGIAVDNSGNAYITGEALSLDFPTTPGAFQTPPYAFDTFITKLNSSGSALVYSSRFGSSFDDYGRDIALDVSGNAYITGWTKCAAPTCDFPTVNAFQSNYGGGNNDAFVTKINPSGSALVYSTYLGGGAILNTTDDWGDGIAVDNSGSAYVTGYTYSQDFPTTSGAFDTINNGLDIFVTKFSPAGSALVYSTFIGGVGSDQGLDIAVNANGNAYITGLTDSEDNPFTQRYEGFPVTSGAFQRSGSFDAFVTQLNAQGSALVYSTYLGGSNDVDRAWGIALDAAGNAHVAGDTKSSNFPVTNAVQSNYGGGLNDAFVAKLNADGSALLYSTFLGGTLTDEGRGIAVDSSANAYVIGFTSSFDFPVTNSVFQPQNGGGLSSHDDAFVSKITDSSSGGELPVAPSGLTAKAVSRTQINLNWTDNSNNETGFKIERCQGTGCTNFQQIATALSNATSFNDTGLNGKKRYRYRVRAYNDSGNSAYTNIAGAKT